MTERVGHEECSTTPRNIAGMARAAATERRP
jgi:hypothetical protein